MYCFLIGDTEVESPPMLVEPGLWQSRASWRLDFGFGAVVLYRTAPGCNTGRLAVLMAHVHASNEAAESKTNDGFIQTYLVQLYLLLVLFAEHRTYCS